MEKHKPVETPWGESQYSRHMAAGITFYSTAGHGGAELSVERQRQFYGRFPSFRTFCGAAKWFEEDCDIAAIVLAFADEFTNAQVYNACRSAELSAKWEGENGHRVRGWRDLREWLNSADVAAVSIRSRCARFQSEIADKWERGGMASTGAEYPLHTLEVRFRNATTGESKRVILDGYPTQQFYTAEEIESARFKGQPAPKRPAVAVYSGCYYDDGPSDADPGL